MIQRRTQTTFFTALTLAFGVLAMPLFAQDAPEDMGNTTQPAGDSADAASGEIVCKVVAVRGRAMFQATEDLPRQPLEVGQILPVGSIITTGVRGSVDLSLGPNADVTIERISVVTIGRLMQEGDSIRTLLGVQRGKIDFHVKRVGFNNDFKVATPNGTMAVRGTEGEIIVDDQTDINGDPLNGGNSINFGQNSDGSNSNLTGNQEFDGGTGGGVTDGHGHDTGGGSNTSNNSNKGDGNGNDPGDFLPDTDEFNGNSNFENQQQQFQKEATDGGGNTGSGGDR
jgi:hypothetical protein